MRKKIDNRIRVLIENGVAKKERSMFVIVGDHGRDQVVILHHMLAKSMIKARPSVLWCYKKELGFSSHRKKRMKQLQKKIKSGKLDVKEDDPFELFIASTQIRYCYYGETHKILGNTYGMCVLQDFEALTPNLLARTIETVEGGGIVVILLRSVTSLKQLYTMTMDCHSRYRTEAHKDVVGRFNERLVLSLASCKNCMVINDQLDLLPISFHMLNVTAVPPKSADDPLPKSVQELKDVQESLQDTQPVGTLVNCCKTLDQAKGLLKFVEAISEKTLRTTVAMTAARGRGKSAALGLSMATAVAFGYSNIFVTAPSPENLKTLFEFVFKGFDALDYQEHMDYELVQSTNPEFNKAIVRVNIFREHRQTIQYIHPSDGHKLGQAELLIIDEAAAIPLPLVKSLLGPYLVFMASTVNGYEGTGRSLSLKLIQELRMKSALDKSDKTAKSAQNTATGRSFYEITLEESIRYADGDAVEKWLNDLLCLDLSNVQRIQSGTPLPKDCELYYVNRDTLFSYHKASENFLQRIMSLYVASHYKNSPNDLQLLSDAPAHHVFCLLGPVDPQQTTLPEVLCVLQVCLEGEISKKTIMDGLSQGKRASGDLIPWTISQQFQDHNFGCLSGCRVVRIATHPDYQQMGYGTRTLELLEQYYEGRIPSLAEDDRDTEEMDTFSGNVENLLEERIAPRKNLPPLLVKLSERRAERLDYLGVSFGLTRELLRFWKKSKFVPVYLRQNANDLTGEHTCIMLKRLHEAAESAESAESANGGETGVDAGSDWLRAFWFDFRRRAISLMGYEFVKFHPALVLNLLQQKRLEGKKEGLTKPELDLILSNYDVHRLELYSRNMVDYHLIMDLLPGLARLYFLNKLDVNVSMAQAAILMMFGLQYKNVDDIVKALDLPHTQVLGLFSRTVKKIVQYLSTITELEIEKEMRVSADHVVMEPVPTALHEELAEAGREVESQQKKQLDQLKHSNLAQYAIKGSEHEWSKALSSSKEKKLISIGHQSQSTLKRKSEAQPTEDNLDRKKKKKYKNFKKK